MIVVKPGTKDGVCVREVVIGQERLDGLRVVGGNIGDSGEQRYLSYSLSFSLSLSVSLFIWLYVYVYMYTCIYIYICTLKKGPGPGP